MPATIGEGRALAVRYRALATILPYSGRPTTPCEIVRQRAFFANNLLAAIRLPQAVLREVEPGKFETLGSP